MEGDQLPDYEYDLGDHQEEGKNGAEGADGKK